MSLEELRSKAFFQNTIDVWIMCCQEKTWDWYDVDAVQTFHLLFKIQRSQNAEVPALYKGIRRHV